MVFHEERKDFKRNFKNRGKIKRIFCTRNVFNPREQKQKTKEFFPHFTTKTHSCFGIHQKGEKKRNRVEKKNQKKAGYKNEKPFFKTQKKDQTWENM